MQRAILVRTVQIDSAVGGGYSKAVDVRSVRRRDMTFLGGLLIGILGSIIGQYLWELHRKHEYGQGSDVLRRGRSLCG